VDLGVPRNVEPEVRGLENLFLHDLDSLQHLLERNLERRRTQIPRVERIVAQEVERCTAWLHGLRAEPLVARLQQRAEEIRRRELASARRRIPAEYHEDLERLTRALVRKILHHPSNRLRNADGEDQLAHLEAARELFQLGVEEAEEESED
jgi:glutamyl-tRNA reductase